MSWRRMASIAASIAVVGTVAVVLVPGHGEGGRAAGDLSAAVEAIRSHGAGALWLRPVSHLEDLLPTTELVHPDGRRVRIVDALVLARVVRVEHGRAHTYSESGRHEVAFDSRDAETRTLHLVLEVEETFAGGTPPTTVGLVVGGREDVREIERSLTDLGRVLVPITMGTAVFDYQDGLGAIAQDGQLLGLVDDFGGITLPALDREEAARFLREVDTIDELRAAAADAPLLIPVDASGTPVEPSVE